SGNVIWLRNLRFPRPTPHTGSPVGNRRASRCSLRARAQGPWRQLRTVRFKREYLDNAGIIDFDEWRFYVDFQNPHALVLLALFQNAGFVVGRSRGPGRKMDV